MGRKNQADFSIGHFHFPRRMFNAIMHMVKKKTSENATVSFSDTREFPDLGQHLKFPCKRDVHRQV
jgi:hypothetical protein